MTRPSPLPTSHPLHRRLAALGLIAVLLTAGCTSGFGSTVTILSRDGQASLSQTDARTTVAVGLDLGTAFSTQATTPKSQAQINHITVKLWDWNGTALGTQRATHATGSDAVRNVQFNNVPPGRFKVTAEAFSSTNDTTSITQGGPTPSVNDVVVAVASNPTYSAPDPTRLVVNLQLSNGAGDNLNNTVTLIDGRSPTEGRMAPDDSGSATAFHNYAVMVNGVTSTFVWVPHFTAIQLINPTACGTVTRPIGAADNALPAGYWVDGTTPPNSGTQGTDWVKEDFGGFYAAKYEASRADASNTAAGGSSDLSVRPTVVPWSNVDWDTAAMACRMYHPYAHLMRDVEWTALVVWAQIHGFTVEGNTNSLADYSNTSTVFTTDPTAATPNTRALTGSGSNAGWTAGQNTTSNTTQTNGVYDLVGNVAEWTASVSKNGTDDNWVVDGFSTGVAASTDGGSPPAWVVGLSTDPLLRRLGLPLLSGTATGSYWGYDGATHPSLTAAKAVRGGTFSDTMHAGLWNMSLANARTTQSGQIGFRPCLRF